MECTILVLYHVTKAEKYQVGDRSRVFNDDWSSKSFFTGSAGKVICLVCKRSICIMEVDNIRYDFEEHEGTKSVLCKLL
jgi:hypothetical protein